MPDVTSKPLHPVRRISPAIRKAVNIPTRSPVRGILWLITLRWVACAGLFFVIWFSSAVLGALADPVPLYVIGLVLAGYNLLFWILFHKIPDLSGEKIVWNIFLQINLDLFALTLLLYFSGFSHNPFIFYFVFHIIIAGILLPRWMAYFEAILASVLVGAVMLLQYEGVIPEHRLMIAFLQSRTSSGENIYLLGKFAALSSTMLIAVYFTISVLRHVRHAESKIRQREKILSMGQLVSGILHQIKNPLDGLHNCLHQLSQLTEERKSADSYITLMNDELKRIEKLTCRLQDYARPHGIEICPVDVNRVVTEVLPLLKVKEKGMIEIHTELGQIPAVRGDPFALQEVLINLYTNAFEAMPRGGTLTVRTYPAMIKLERSVGGVAIDVTDTGVGIKPGERELVFEPFYTNKDPSKGTGLGLWLCHMLVTDMGGRIEMESTPGRGSTFRVLLEKW